MKTNLKIRHLLALVSLVFSVAIQAATYPLPAYGDDLVGNDFSVRIKSGDTLVALGKKYGVGLHEILEANPKAKPTRLKIGQQINIPTRYILPPKQYRKGIVINIAELRLYNFTKKGYVMTYPVGLGKIDWRTPTSKTYLYKKVVDPDWHVPKSIREYTLEKNGKVLPKVVKAGPDNPLGPRALYLGLSGYLIHGNNSPNSIGKLVSSGCIRMHNEDVIELYDTVEKGIPVHIIHHANKAGWENGQLYLESHRPVFLDEEYSKLNNMPAEVAIQNAMGKSGAEIDWVKASRIGYYQSGIPQPVN